MKAASVILDLAIGKPLDYEIPEALSSAILPGVRVQVPLRGKIQSGTVLSLKPREEQRTLAKIHSVLASEALPQDLLDLAQWMSEYYCTPLHAVLKIILPKSVRKIIKPKTQLFVARAKTKEELANYCKAIRNRYPAQASVLDIMLTARKGILLTELLEKTEVNRGTVETLAKKNFLSLSQVHVDRSPLEEEEYFLTKSKNLNSEQAEVFQQLSKSIEENCFVTYLIHGITGSGKTEIYMQAIQKALDLNKSALMLVPEISLTAQMIERFKSRFPIKMAVLHHRLSDGERYGLWQEIAQGTIKLVIGARSAVFSPLCNLGLIIVDEEHESAYKNEEHPSYHGRDVAVMRGKLNKAVVVLGSATPSLESYFNAKQSKYILKNLFFRADQALIPNVTIVDMRKEFEKSKGFTAFSEALLQGIEKRQKAGEQTLLFLNRRGYHSSLLCQQCGKTVKCKHCDITLTYHHHEQTLACHLCNFRLPHLKKCPSCQSDQAMKYRGMGTELIEKSLLAIFPTLRTLRMDADTTRHKGSHQKLIRDFATGKADVLIGTQMIAKGLHFPEVTLVGILNADPGLNVPDFRSAEYAFQMITQVSGRSGRGVLPGEVILQTMLPENSAIQFAAKQDFISFYEEEIEVRKAFGYPPFTRMVKVLFSGASEEETVRYAQRFHERLLKELPSEYLIHPLLPCGHAKIKDRYRYQFLMRGPQVLLMSHALKKVKEGLNEKNIHVFLDINPASTYL